ncbi:hypothetical protein [Aeromicrobium sp. NPDC092404]|uniref:hypothetical protein n=1 Tax=Aeromicrobium sp. NPDC092404 TaxID=3154976 RepID=UPI00343DE228
MPNVVTPFTRKRQAVAAAPAVAPRHRRDGWFDDKDQWHDAAESVEPARAHG